MRQTGWFHWMISTFTYLFAMQFHLGHLCTVHVIGNVPRFMKSYNCTYVLFNLLFIYFFNLARSLTVNVIGNIPWFMESFDSFPISKSSPL